MHKVQERRCATPYSFENLDWLPFVIDSRLRDCKSQRCEERSEGGAVKAEHTAEKRKAFILRRCARRRRIVKGDYTVFRFNVCIDLFNSFCYPCAEKEKTARV